MSTAETNTSHASGGTASAEDKQQAPGDSILGRKLKKILESDLETDSETAEALEELSTFFTDNSLHTRRFLRGEIERRSLQGWQSLMFLKHSKTDDYTHGWYIRDVRKTDTSPVPKFWPMLDSFCPFRHPLYIQTF